MRRFDLNLMQRVRASRERRTPSHLLGGRVRTSTVVLIVAFLALWWTYGTYRPRPEPSTSNPPPGQVVPPGFVPDPGYTWVPRTRVQQPPATSTPTPTTTTPPSPAPPTTTTTTTQQFPPSLPCLLPPPFCPATPTTPTTPTPTTPQPEPGPTPPAR